MCLYFIILSFFNFVDYYAARGIKIFEKLGGGGRMIQKKKNKICKHWVKGNLELELVVEYGVILELGLGLGLGFRLRLE